MITFLSALATALVLVYGVLLSVYFAGGFRAKKEHLAITLLILLILLSQIYFYFALGLETTRKIYPFNTHLPIIIFMVLYMKKPLGISIVSVTTAYLCCQFPRWAGVTAEFFFGSTLAYLIGYSIFIALFFYLLRKYFVEPTYRAMSFSRNSLFLFAVFPVFYYFFSYASSVYTDALYRATPMVNESLPVIMTVFFLFFVVLFHDEVQKRNKVELDRSLLAMQLQQASNQIKNAEEAQELSRIYRHDLRHHFSLVKAYLEAKESYKAIEYIHSEISDIDAITSIRYCLNQALNLIFSAFATKAELHGVKLKIEANVPEELSLPENELCAIISNGLENAIRETSEIAFLEKTVCVQCRIHKEKLLLNIENPVENTVLIKNGLPQRPGGKGTGFGTKSIEMLTRKNQGYSSFSTSGNLFSLKVVLPLKKN